MHNQSANLSCQAAHALESPGNNRPHRRSEITYEEGECLLELGDLLLGERISLQYGVSTASRGWPAGGRCVDFPRRGMGAGVGQRGAYCYAPCLLWRGGLAGEVQSRAENNRQTGAGYGGVYKGRCGVCRRFGRVCGWTVRVELAVRLAALAAPCAVGRGLIAAEKGKAGRYSPAPELCSCDGAAARPGDRPSSAIPITQRASVHCPSEATVERPRLRLRLRLP